MLANHPSVLGSSGGGSGSVAGTVVGPASSTDNAVARFNGTTGEIIQNSGVIIDDSNIITQPGTNIYTAAAMAALAIDVTKLLNTKTISADQTFTFSGTPATANQVFGMLVTNSDSSAHTLTIPSSFSVGRGGAITTVIIGASGGKLYLTWQYDGSAYNLYGDPVAVTGTGSYVLQSGPTMQGAWLQDENSYIQMDTALSADGKFCGICEAGTAGATLAFGDHVYFAAADSKWELTDADAASTAGDVSIGMCVLAAAEDAATLILRYGKIRADAAFPDLTVGAPVYISTTPGDIQVAAPSGTDDVIRRIGFGVTANELFFCPSPDYITST